MTDTPCIVVAQCSLRKGDVVTQGAFSIRDNSFFQTLMQTVTTRGIELPHNFVSLNKTFVRIVKAAMTLGHKDTSYNYDDIVRAYFSQQVCEKNGTCNAIFLPFTFISTCKITDRVVFKTLALWDTLNVSERVAYIRQHKKPIDKENQIREYIAQMKCVDIMLFVFFLNSRVATHLGDSNEFMLALYKNMSVLISGDSDRGIGESGIIYSIVIDVILAIHKAVIDGFFSKLASKSVAKVRFQLLLPLDVSGTASSGPFVNFDAPIFDRSPRRRLIACDHLPLKTAILNLMMYNASVSAVLHANTNNANIVVDSNHVACLALCVTDEKLLATIATLGELLSFAKENKSFCREARVAISKHLGMLHGAPVSVMMHYLMMELIFHTNISPQPRYDEVTSHNVLGFVVDTQKLDSLMKFIGTLTDIKTSIRECMYQDFMASETKKKPDKPAPCIVATVSTQPKNPDFSVFSNFGVFESETCVKNESIYTIQNPFDIKFTVALTV